MAQRSIEILIGRLITDEEFRTAYIDSPLVTLRTFIASGHELTGVEIHALNTIGPSLWGQIAERIDPRLQKAVLK